MPLAESIFRLNGDEITSASASDRLSTDSGLTRIALSEATSSNADP